MNSWITFPGDGTRHKTVAGHKRVAEWNVPSLRPSANADDTLVISRNSSHLKRLTQTHADLKAYTTFIVHEIQNSKQYGVVDAKHEQDEVYRVKSAVEKPDFPPSNLAIIPLYIFHPEISEAFAGLRPGRDGEIQLTDAIQKLVDWRRKVYAIKLKPDETRLDVKTPETYWDALRLSFLYGV
jgi:UTP--glucose-1-phosphate uridylyltransferase